MFFDSIDMAEEFADDEQLVVYHGSCLDLLKDIPERSIQLIVTSPPYNIGKEYERREPLDRYVEQQRAVIRACERVLAETGSERLVRRTMALSPEAQKAEIEAADDTPIFSYNQTDFVKRRVAIEVQFGKYAFVAYDLFVKHLAFYVGDQIDVGVEILPMKNLQSQMSSGVAYYQGELYNVIRQGRGVPAVPLVLIGIEP